MSESAVPEGHYVDIGDDLRVHYHEVGEGPAVVFIHGSGPGASGYSNFKLNFGHLGEHGFRVLVPDMIGYGHSSKPADAEYTLAFLAGAMGRFLDAVGVQRCALVGNSLGGAVCIRLALDHPGRIERLVLMAPGGLEPRETYMEMRGIRRMLRCIFGPEGITAEGMRKVFELQLYDSTLLDDVTLAERLQIAELQPKAVFATSLVPNQSEELANLACPVFALWGRDDQFCPVSGAQTIAQSCSQVRVMTLSECGHWVMVEHAELFNRLCLDFLREGAAQA